jgi:hypothetical protein
MSGDLLSREVGDGNQHVGGPSGVRKEEPLAGHADSIDRTRDVEHCQVVNGCHGRNPPSERHIDVETMHEIGATDRPQPLKCPADPRRGRPHQREHALGQCDDGVRLHHRSKLPFGSDRLYVDQHLADVRLYTTALRSQG